MTLLLFLIILFGIFSAASIVITGDRGLISGDLYGAKLIELVLNKHFLFAMILAFGSRLLFILINNSLLKMPELAKNSTTITTFVTASSYIFIILANFIFLKERLTLQQALGSALILSGILVMFK